MTENSQFRVNSKVAETMRDFLKRVEGTAEPNAKNPNNINVLRNSASGISVGELQVDMSKNDDLARALDDIAVAKGIVRPDSIKSLDLTKRSATIEKAKTADIQKHLDAVLKTPEGKAALAAAEEAQISKVNRAIESACSQAGPNAKKFCTSPEGQREIAAYAHQYGPDDVSRLTAYLRGEKVKIGESKSNPSGNEVQLKEELTVEGFRNGYRNKTKWGEENRRPARTRDGNVDDANRNIPVSNAPDAGQPEKSNQRADIADEPNEMHTAKAEAVEDEQHEEETPTQLAEAKPAPTQAATQSLQQPLPEQRRQPWETYPPRPPFNFLDPTMKSPRYNLPSGLAALLGIPHAPGGGGDGDFAALAKQVGGEGLPPLVSDLLGSGVSRTNPKSAVKLFQTTINALNKPEDFDWNWSTSGKIDVDGDLGPQTRAGFGRALEKAGPEGFARKFALGQFRDYATRLDNGIERYENLAGAVDGSLGRIDRNAAAPFQDYLNVARDNLPPHVRYEGLKRDGWIGPKTTDAFKTALYNLGPATIADDLEGLFVA